MDKAQEDPRSCYARGSLKIHLYILGHSSLQMVEPSALLLDGGPPCDSPGALSRQDWRHGAAGQALSHGPALLSLGSQLRRNRAAHHGTPPAARGETQVRRTSTPTRPVRKATWASMLWPSSGFHQPSGGTQPYWHRGHCCPAPQKLS